MDPHRICPTSIPLVPALKAAWQTALDHMVAPIQAIIPDSADSLLTVLAVLPVACQH